MMMAPVTGLEVAVVGMAARVPGASNLNDLWQLLCQGLDVLQQQQLREGRGINPLGGVLDDVHDFDADFFSLAAREACLMDPQLRQGLQVGWQALEDAALINRRQDSCVGVYAGAPTSAYLTYALSQQQQLATDIGIDELLQHNSQELFAGKLAYHLGLTGPAMSMLSGCATSLVALHYATLALNAGDCEHALVLGSRIGYPHFTGYNADPSGPLSLDGRCRPFSQTAAGMVPASGTLAVVLKRYEDALADGDRVYAVIRGSALNNDGKDKLGFAAPAVDGQAEVAAQALANAEVDASEVSYIEAHGTGTELGDGVELRALQQAYGDTSKAGLGVGSIKGNIGHLDAASGLASLVKVCLMLFHRTLVPSINCDKPLQQLQQSHGWSLQQTCSPWQAEQGLIAAVNIFGIGGTNGHLVLQAAQSPPQLPERQFASLMISADTPEAVLRNRDSLVQWLQSQTQVNFTQLSWTLLACRQAQPYRLAVALNNHDDIAQLATLTTHEVRYAGDTEMISLSYISSDSMAGIQSLLDSDAILAQDFITHLQRSAEGDLVTPLWPWLVRQMQQSAHWQFMVNRALWLSLLTRLQQLGVKFTQLYAPGPLTVIAAEWLQLITKEQGAAWYPGQGAISLQANDANTQVALCDNSGKAIALSLLQSQQYWQQLSEVVALQHNEILKPLTMQRLSAVLAQLWCHGLGIDEDQCFGRHTPANIPGYAFAKHSFTLPLHAAEPLHWQQQRWQAINASPQAIECVVVLLPSNRAAKAMRQYFSQAAKQVWFVSSSKFFKVSRARTVQADLTQPEHLKQLHQLIAATSPARWHVIDARASSLSSNAMATVQHYFQPQFRASCALLAKYINQHRHCYTLVAYAAMTHQQGINQDFLLRYWQRDSDKLGWLEPPNILLIAMPRSRLLAFKSEAVDAVELNKIATASGTEFMLYRGRVLQQSHCLVNSVDAELQRYQHCVFVGIEQPSGLALAKQLSASCSQLKLVLPSDFPLPELWSAWRHRHIANNHYSQVIAWLQQADPATLQYHHPALHGKRAAKALLAREVDLWVNLVAVESWLAEPQNLKGQQQQWRLLQSLLKPQREEKTVLNLLQGPCTVALQSSGQRWRSWLSGTVQSSVTIATEDIAAVPLTAATTLLQNHSHQLVATFKTESAPDAMESNVIDLAETQHYSQRPALETAFVEPQPGLETQVAQIWQNYFYIDAIGRDDNFFQLNGHSLLALKIVNQINQTLSLTVTLQQFLSHPTVAQLCRLLNKEQANVEQGAAS